MLLIAGLINSSTTIFSRGIRRSMLSKICLLVLTLEVLSIQEDDVQMEQKGIGVLETPYMFDQSGNLMMDDPVTIEGLRDTLRGEQRRSHRRCHCKKHSHRAKNQRRTSKSKTNRPGSNNFRGSGRLNHGRNIFRVDFGNRKPKNPEVPENQRVENPKQTRPVVSTGGYKLPSGVLPIILKLEKSGKFRSGGGGPYFVQDEFDLRVIGTSNGTSKVKGTRALLVFPNSSK